jgi:hypothetical protein
MGPQPCPDQCAKGTLSELASETSRSKWAHSEGVKWEWRTSEVQHTKCAWWRLCVPCHRLAWPLDRRNRNGSSLPWESLCATRPGDRQKGVVQRSAGDFWLTCAPPEWVATLDSADRQRKSRRRSAAAAPAVRGFARLGLLVILRGSLLWAEHTEALNAEKRSIKR